jgi:putative flippase GtrA
MGQGENQGAPGCAGPDGSTSLGHMAATVTLAAPGWATGDRVCAQLLRFALVGGTASAVYGGLFLALTGLGSQVANLIGVAASTALANELHRRVTFRAGARVGWATAQWAGGGMALAGLAASSLTLAALDAWTVSSGPLVAVLAVCAVSAVVGLGRFVGLRWVLVRNRDAHVSASSVASWPRARPGRSTTDDGRRAPLPRPASRRHRAPARPRRRPLGGQRLAGRCAVPGAVVVRLGRRGAAPGHAREEPHRPEIWPPPERSGWRWGTPATSS